MNMLVHRLSEKNHVPCAVVCRFSNRQCSWQLLEQKQKYCENAEPSCSNCCTSVRIAKAQHQPALVARMGRLKSCCSTIRDLLWAPRCSDLNLQQGNATVRRCASLHFLGEFVPGTAKRWQATQTQWLNLGSHPMLVMRPSA